MLKRTRLSLSLVLYLSCTLLGSITVQQSHTQLYQSDTLLIKVHSNTPLDSVTAKLGKRRFTGFPLNKHKTAFRIYMGIHVNSPTGNQTILVQSLTPTNQTTKKTLNLTIKEKKFKKTQLHFNKTKSKVANNRTALLKESQEIGRNFRKKTSYHYFKDPFIRPTRGRISSPFGAYRTYKNNNTSRKHTGTDIANLKNTPIYAANAGKVILSKSYYSHGNTIMINHGLGVVTIYNHLNKRLVKTGQRVKRGQKIGLIGDTGIATGPHLHWGMSIQNVRVDPLFWLKEISLY